MTTADFAVDRSSAVTSDDVARSGVALDELGDGSQGPVSLEVAVTVVVPLEVVHVEDGEGDGLAAPASSPELLLQLGAKVAIVVESRERVADRGVLRLLEDLDLDDLRIGEVLVDGDEVVEQSDPEAAVKIVTLLKELGRDNDKLKRMGDAARELGRPEAGRLMAQRLGAS